MKNSEINAVFQTSVGNTLQLLFQGLFVDNQLFNCVSRCVLHA
jgi:hypothetical protein